MRLLRRLFHRPAIRMGSVDNSRLRTTPIRNAGFVSFFAGQGCATARTTDYHEARLRRQKFFRMIVVASVTALGTWVVVESARAVTTF